MATGIGLFCSMDGIALSNCPLCWKQTGAQRAAFVTAGDLLRPGEELYSPPGQELLGVITSHGLKEPVAAKASREAVLAF
jgi:hypothetical protein